MRTLIFGKQTQEEFSAFPIRSVELRLGENPKINKRFPPFFKHPRVNFRKSVFLKYVVGQIIHRIIRKRQFCVYTPKKPTGFSY